ncbi:MULTISPECIES: benzoylformate decarboxylase [Providencia]|uniref:Benzoylformate decarboxylase n=1 Tax=Providencia rettgeri TaxID=587 RepID=A0A379FNE6_PRORE|nr:MULTISPECIES: benzoylformate decarboxylase [Providencia]EJD6377666.1 benzoylformate decarboxylase [Providencia rettgeri]EJF7713023.1 benzoylformate decarboxylase [Providencia rettgeri]ELH9584811.1 benzoylformate decarboxylase [Providencia rettgeri]ELM3938566.1 benzoylformate decarboxylase [Providencia rettgeri]ELR5118569.1 benzoylformate decarboxylase [Providencia rettgeri]
MQKTIRQVTYDLLRKLGITTIFGNPGSTEETFLKDFPSDFRYIQTLQEASAVAAADGYAQGMRKVAMVNVHTSAGLSNAMSNILTAYMNRTPLIITAGNQTREMLLMEPWLTNIEPETLPKPWVKWSYQPVRAEDVPAAFMRAYAMALQPPAGPVFLSIPLDDWDKPALAQEAVVRSVPQRIGYDPARLQEFASALSNAKNPVLIYGSAIARGEGWDIGIKLAEKLNAPVWAAPASERPPFPETHPLYAGGLPFATKPLSEKLEGHDLAIVIGAPVFRYYPYVAGSYIPEGLKLLHITDDPIEVARAPIGDSLLSDAVLALEGLINLVAPRTGTKTVEKQPHGMAPYPAAAEQSSNSPTLSATQLFRTLREVSPKETVLVEESPSNLGELHREWPIEFPDSFYTFASGSLGWNLPASVGIALAERDSGRHRPVMAIIGDGSMQYSIQGLWSAAQQNLPIVFIIPKNNEYGILKSFAVLEETPGVPGLDIPNLDIVALGKGYGCAAVRAETIEDIKQACEEAFRRNGPTVIEVPILPSIPPLI